MEPVPVNYGKLATKYPWIYGHFYSVFMPCVSSSYHHRNHHHLHQHQQQWPQCFDGARGMDEDEMR